MANITPIHEKGNKHKKENYCQISLTSVVCKVTENMVRSRVTASWSNNHVLNPNQFGYLKGKSSLAELLSCYHHWCLTRNSSKATDVIFFRCIKAFDRVPHERLLLKLNRHGIDAPLLLWFRNFLKNRQQSESHNTWNIFELVPSDIWCSARNNPRAHLVLTQRK